LDLKKLSPGEIVIAVSGIVLLIFSFLPWYKVGGVSFSTPVGTVGGGGISLNGWDDPSQLSSILAILIGVVMAAHVIVTKLAGLSLPERLGGVGWGVFYLAGGVLAFLFLLLKFLDYSDHTKVSFYISLLAGLGLAVGGFLAAKERGDLAVFQSPGGASGGTPPTPPPAPPTPPPA
jgi:hypothetical protein